MLSIALVKTIFVKQIKDFITSLIWLSVITNNSSFCHSEHRKTSVSLVWNLRTKFSRWVKTRAYELAKQSFNYQLDFSPDSYRDVGIAKYRKIMYYDTLRIYKFFY